MILCFNFMLQSHPVCGVVVETGVVTRSLFEGRGLVSESTSPAFLLGLVSVSDKEDSCDFISRLPVHCLIYLLISLLLLDVKHHASNATNNFTNFSFEMTHNPSSHPKSQ